MYKGRKITPAMKAGITSHIWSLREILTFEKEEKTN